VAKQTYIQVETTPEWQGPPEPSKAELSPHHDSETGKFIAGNKARRGKATGARGPYRRIRALRSQILDAAEDDEGGIASLWQVLVRIAHSDSATPGERILAARVALEFSLGRPSESPDLLADAEAVLRQIQAAQQSAPLEGHEFAELVRGELAAPKPADEKSEAPE